MCSSGSGGQCRKILPSSPEASPSATRAGILDIIAKRRMIRSFHDAPVESQLVDALVTAAHAGPSAGNSRSLELLVLRDDEVANYWSVTLPESARASFPWPGLLIAPLLIVPYIDPSMYVDRYSEADKERTGLGVGVDAWSVPYWWVDGGAATENLLLAATGLGLGACLFGQFEHEAAVRERFGVPADMRAIGTIAIGYPDRDNDRRSKSAGRPRRPAADVTHYGSWQPT